MARWNGGSARTSWSSRQQHDPTYTHTFLIFSGKARQTLKICSTGRTLTSVPGSCKSLLAYRDCQRSFSRAPSKDLALPKKLQVGFSQAPSPGSRENLCLPLIPQKPLRGIQSLPTPTLKQIHSLVPFSLPALPECQG